MVWQSLFWLIFALANRPGGLIGEPITDRASVEVRYAQEAAVISSDRGVAVVRFEGAIPEGRKYAYRFLASGAGREERGEGEVFEKYERRPAEPPLDGVVVTDVGSQLHVRAGAIDLVWSLGNDDGGWLYFDPQKQHIEMLPADQFEKVDLARFAKRDAR